MAEEKSPLKQALAALVGMPVEAVIVQFGDSIKPAEAEMIRRMSAEDKCPAGLL